MGDAQRQSSLTSLVVFLDENHCGNRHLHHALSAAGIPYEKHTDHFPRGVDDTVWIPEVARRDWVLLTADTRIRRNSLERLAVKTYALRMFYFSRNDVAGAAMGQALKKALPRMLRICAIEVPPFAASITRNGDVVVRDRFENED